MAVPKAPRTTPAAEARPGPGKLIAALPDRREMEAFAATRKDGSGRDGPRRPRRGSDPTAKAQHVIYDAWEQRPAATTLPVLRPPASSPA